MSAYQGEHEADLRPFVDAMRYKLASNRHKGRSWEDMTPAKLLKRIREETTELRDAIRRGNCTEILLEAADVANFAMMVANIAIKRANQGAGSGLFDQVAYDRARDVLDQIIAPPYPPRVPSGVDPDRQQYGVQGMWTPDVETHIVMWCHKITGMVVYEDHPMTRDRKLPIAPWTVPATDVRA